MKKNFLYTPSFNEALNLNALLNKFNKFYKKNIRVLILIIDDGSTDNSIQIIKGFIKKHNTKKLNIKIIQHIKNLGLGRALEQGLSIAF